MDGRLDRTTTIKTAMLGVRIGELIAGYGTLGQAAPYMRLGVVKPDIEKRTPWCLKAGSFQKTSSIQGKTRLQRTEKNETRRISRTHGGGEHHETGAEGGWPGVHQDKTGMVLSHENVYSREARSGRTRVATTA